LVVERHQDPPPDWTLKEKRRRDSRKVGIHAATTREQEHDATGVEPEHLHPCEGSNPPLEQASIGRSLVIKGEVSGSESLYVDGRIEGTINIPEHRITIGRNGTVTAA